MRNRTFSASRSLTGRRLPLLTTPPALASAIHFAKVLAEIPRLRAAAVAPRLSASKTASALKSAVY